MDWDAERSAGGKSGFNSAARALTFWVNSAVIRGCGFAHWDVATARQQSWLQQLVSRMER